MPDQFNNKDYSDYFSALEKSVEKGSDSNQSSRPTNCRNSNQKLFGGVIRLRSWVYVVAVLVTMLIIALIIKACSVSNDNPLPQPPETESTRQETHDVQKGDEKPSLFAEFDADTAEIAADIDSKNVIVINCETNKVVAARGATTRCYPASTTKIMTVLTAVDYIKDYNQTFTFSYEVTDPFYRQEATMAGFADGEAITLTDMLYGAILESGADATYGIAVTLAGSEEEFVKLMNKKADELGLKDTNFTNTTGLFDKNHYTTPEDMAVIVREAMKNELLNKILSTYQYTTATTAQHPQGIALQSTLFTYMYGTEPEGSDILGGKTGFVNESGYCIASFGQSDSGTDYVCVTLNGLSLWPTVYDQIDLYTRYAK